MLPSRQERNDALEKLRELNKSIKETFFVGKHKPEVNNNATKEAATSKERSSNKRNKDTIDINILSSNVRSFNNKKVSIENILNSKSVDIGVFSEINTKRIPRFKGKVH